jgi:hypothetical protein
LTTDGALGEEVNHRDKRICKSLTNEYTITILLLDVISTMEQTLLIAQNITTIFGAILSIG